jgi:hypothetical protein
MMMSLPASAMLKKYVLIRLGAISAIGIIPLISSSVTASTVCRVGRVLDLQVVQGQQEWASRAAARVAGSAWQFNDNGTFIFAPANSRTDLYPMQGTFQRQGNLIQFRGSSATGSTVSRLNASVQGQIDLSQSPPVLSLGWATSSITAAVVNSSRFGQNSTSLYRATALLIC